MIYIQIFLSRLIDVTLGTIRTICIINNKKIIASIIAFFEILIWYYSIKYIIILNDNIFIPLIYSLGFSVGTFIGIYINSYFSNDLYDVTIITKNIIKNKEYIYKLDNKYIYKLILNKKELINMKDNNMDIYYNQIKKI